MSNTITVEEDLMIEQHEGMLLLLNKSYNGAAI